MSDVVYLKRYKGDEGKLRDINYKELWRYAGYMGGPDSGDDALNSLLEETLKECQSIYNYGVCYTRFELTFAEANVVLPFEVASDNLNNLLKESREAVMFAATIGGQIDRMIAKYERFNPTKALLLQALGAERVEALCDTFCNEINESLKADGYMITPRFSPGYGDVPLDIQKDFMRILDCNRKIGVTLNDSLLMSPSKSVTAIFGITRLDDCQVSSNGSNCDICNMVECDYKH